MREIPTEWAIILVAFVFFASLYGNIITTVVQHENTHYQIFTQNLINSTIEYKPFLLGGHVVPEENWTKAYDVERARKIIDLHLLNEIVGYNVMSIVIAILSGCLMISIAILLRRDVKNGT